MPFLHSDTTAAVAQPPQVASAFADLFVDPVRSPLHVQAGPARVIEVGEVTAGIAVPERGGVRFFSSERRFDPLDGVVFGSVEQAAKAARDRFRALTRPPGPPRTRGLTGGAKLRAV